MMLDAGNSAQKTEDTLMISLDRAEAAFLLTCFAMIGFLLGVAI